MEEGAQFNVSDVHGYDFFSEIRDVWINVSDAPLCFVSRGESGGRVRTENRAGNGPFYTDCNGFSKRT